MFSGVGAGILVTGLGCLVFMIVEIDSSLSWQIPGAASVLAAAVLSRSMGPEIPATRATVHRGEAQRSTLDWRDYFLWGDGVRLYRSGHIFARHGARHGSVS